ncbi:hypothetical protein M8994_01290 [Brucella sp. 21LCYQ03]|nr:hypothetical protein [Brucella sp. 21LCYQ03]
MLINVRETFVGSLLGGAASVLLLGWSSAMAADVPAKPANAVVNSNLEEDYSVTMNNLGDKDLRLEKGIVECMHNSGESKFFVLVGTPYNVSLADSNEFFADCTNSNKEVNWKVFIENKNDEVNIIRFSHRKWNGSWVTSITDLDGSIDATCGGTPCANTGTPGVPTVGPIVINIRDQ